MVGRKSLLKATNKKPKKSKAGTVSEEAKRKKVIMDAVNRSLGSVKATLEELGLPQSTYYKWVKSFKANGLEGLKTGGPVSDELWKRFAKFQKKQEKLPDEKKSTPEETQTMKGEQDKGKKKELLLKNFDKKSSKKSKKEKAPPSPPSYTPPPEKPPEEPMDKTLKYAISAFALVIGILLMVSLTNTYQFYFKQKKDKVELWQGRFAPMGEELVASFSDMEILKKVPEQDVYSKRQAHDILSDYYIKRADELLNTSETPDLKTVKSYLTNASKYARSRSQRDDIKMRLKSIRFLVLLGKSDIALNKGTVSEFEAAKGYLAQAVPLASTNLQKDVLMKRLAAVEYALATTKINKGETQLADLYREAVNRHLKKAKEYGPEKSPEIDQEITKIKKWLDEFDNKYIGVR